MATNEPFKFDVQSSIKLVRFMIDSDFLKKKTQKKRNHRSLWDSLADELSTEYGWTELTGQIVRKKWTKLHHTYNQKKDASSRSGASGKHRDWALFQIMAEACTSTVQRDPIVTISSTEAVDISEEIDQDIDVVCDEEVLLVGQENDYEMGNSTELEAEDNHDQTPTSSNSSMEARSPATAVTSNPTRTPGRAVLRTRRLASRGNKYTVNDYRAKLVKHLESSANLDSQFSSFLDTMNQYFRYKMAHFPQPAALSQPPSASPPRPAALSRPATLSRPTALSRPQPTSHPQPTSRPQPTSHPQPTSAAQPATVRPAGNRSDQPIMSTNTTSSHGQ